MKTLWMDFFSITTSSAVHGPMAGQQTGRWDRLAFKRNEQGVA